MKIRIDINGSGWGHSLEGEVLCWCQGVEMYHDGQRAQAKQVPAVVIRTDTMVQVVNLQRDLAQIKVTVL